MKAFSKFVGLDTHQDTIAVAVSEADGGSARYYGEITNTPKAIAKLVKTLTAKGDVISFCYEAGPCGYGIYRQLLELGQACAVVAPSLIPTKPGDRVKTDRRDSEALSRLHRAGELTPVWVPAQEQEAMRDLTRAREDMKGLERITKQRLNAFLLCHGRTYARKKSRWTQAHGRWLAGLKFEHMVQQIVFQEYVDTVKQAQARVVGLEKEMATALPNWGLAPVVEALMALRGDYENRKQPRPACARGSRLGLPISSSQNRASPTAGGTDVGSRTGHRLESPKAVVRAVSASAGGWETQSTGLYGCGA